MLFFRKPVNRKAELTFSPLQFVLCRSGLEETVSAHEQTEERSCNEDFPCERVSSSEIGRDLK